MKLDAETEEALVVRVFKSDLQERLDAKVTAGRRALIDRYRTWADKYAITLIEPRGPECCHRRSPQYLPQGSWI